MFSIDATYWKPVMALGAGILILIEPRILAYVIAIYLILVGLIELNVIG
jgi:hypothetical protein